MISHNQIIGRYAPSPTGALHLGNLRTALLAWLQVRLQGGQFLMRMDDLDQPRVIEGSADQILRDLEWMGLDWDGEVVYQSQRHDLYQEALKSLEVQNLVYSCFCSRKDIRQAASAPHAREGVYPSTCASLTGDARLTKAESKTPAYRVRVGNDPIEFVDYCLGYQKESLNHVCGDFVIKRADNLYAYQLATAVDDMQQGITDVLRGADLLDSTSRQIYLMQKLNPQHNLPHYSHVPLMLDEQGQRMAKRDGSFSIAEVRDNGRSAPELVGELAASLNLIEKPLSLEKPLAISANELLAELTIEKWQSQIRSY